MAIFSVFKISNEEKSPHLKELEQDLYDELDCHVNFHQNIYQPKHL